MQRAVRGELLGQDEASRLAKRGRAETQRGNDRELSNGVGDCAVVSGSFLFCGRGRCR